MSVVKMAKNNLLRQHKLVQGRDFKAVFATGEWLPGRYFAFKVRTNDCEHSRLGMVIAKKNVHRAVDRNYLKRIIRERFRVEKNNLGHRDIVVMVFKPILDVPKSERHQCLKEQWKKLGKLLKES